MFSDRGIGNAWNPGCIVTESKTFGYDIVEWPGTVDPQLPAVGQICQAYRIPDKKCIKNAFIWGIHPMDTIVELHWQEAFVLKMHLFGYPFSCLLI